MKMKIFDILDITTEECVVQFSKEEFELIAKKKQKYFEREAGVRSFLT